MHFCSADVDWGFPVPEILCKTSLIFKLYFSPFLEFSLPNFQLYPTTKIAFGVNFKWI